VAAQQVFTRRCRWDRVMMRIAAAERVLPTHDETTGRNDRDAALR